MAAAWLLQDNLRQRFIAFLSNRTALVLSSFYLLHIIGLLWTSDFRPAGNDLRVKLPILLFPLFLASGPSLSKKQVFLILEVFAGAVTISVLTGFAVYLGIIKREVHDIRDISLFVSHIRLSLMICIAAVFHLTRFSGDTGAWKIYRMMSIASGLFFLALTGSMTGMAILAVLIVILGIKATLKLQVVPKALILGSITVIMIFAAAVVFKEVKTFYYFEDERTDELDTHTIHGHAYTHYLDNDDREEGRRVYLYISWEELEDGWVNRSGIDFHGKDRKGQELKYTLVRYMTAVGLRKDKEGLDKLSDEDIKNVEAGITNPLYKNFGIRARIHQVLWELDHYIRGNDPSGHSVSMRLEFWKNGLAVVEDSPLTGVGTGDVKMALNEKYEARHSSLQERWRLRPHNQYLTFTVTFGLIGLTWFLAVLLYPLLNDRSVLYGAFFTTVVLSMLTEDTIETQQGVTLYAFINSFLIFHYNTLVQKRGKE